MLPSSGLLAQPPHGGCASSRLDRGLKLWCSVAPATKKRLKFSDSAMRQLEQDTDREIEELKDEKEARLKAEKDDKVRLRGQSGIHKRNHEELKRQMRT